MNHIHKCPQIIQGGMGAGVSDWRLAKAVSQYGQMGVVSGTALDSILIRRLQLGDPDGRMRDALSRFPWPEMTQPILDEFFVPGGKAPDQPFKLLPMPRLQMEKSSVERIIVANFVEVFLAKAGHNGLVGINYLEKIQLPTLPSLFGAMLADVDYVLMGGGLPLSIPGILDDLSRLDAVQLKIHVEDNPHKHCYMQHFDPKDFCPGKKPNMSRPRFLAIISSEIAAKTMIKRATGHIDGIIVENHTAGGHNAPPRKNIKYHPSSPGKFSKKDIPDIDRIRDLGKPFWLAGGCASPTQLKKALELGARGIQVGTIFAYCRESAILPEIKKAVVAQSLNGGVHVHTDFQASPTGYPFKLISLENTISDERLLERHRLCDVGYLRHLYSINGSEVGYRCPSEPAGMYMAKGGCEELTFGKKCLCNGLLATIGLAQSREGVLELPLVTSGEDFSFMHHIVKKFTSDYTAIDVINFLQS